MSAAPMKYAERAVLGQHLKDEDHDKLVDFYRGFTPSGTFISPYSLIISSDGTDYYASNAFQTIYGGPSNIGVTDAEDAAQVIRAALEDSGTVILAPDTEFLLKSTETLTGIGGAADVEVILRVYPNASLIGLAGSVLKQDAGVNAAVVVTNHAWIPGNGYTPDDNVTIQGVTVDANIANQNYGAFGAGAAKAVGFLLVTYNSTYKDLKAINCGMYGGFQVYGVNSTFNNIHVEGTTTLAGDTSTAYATGMFISSVDANYNHFSNIFIKNCDGDGLMIEDYAHHNTFNGVHIEDVATGITFTPADYNIFNGLTITNVSGRGIALESSIGNKLNGFDIYKSTWGAIVGSDNGVPNRLHNNHFLNGSIVDCGGALTENGGIILSDSLNDEIHNINIRNIDLAFITAGVHLTNCTRTNITNVNTEDVTVQGIRIEDSTYCIVKNNQVHGSATGIIEAPSSDFNIIKDNNLVDNATPFLRSAATGANSILKDNWGYVTENFGVYTGATNQDIAHGLVYSPDNSASGKGYINVTCVSAAIAFQTDVIGPTNFRIVFGGGGNQTFHWYAFFKPYS